MAGLNRAEHGALLTGKVLKRSENQADTGFYWEKSRALYLYDDMSFRYVVRTASSVSGGGLSMPSENEEVAEGRWTVEVRRLDFWLVLKQDEVEVLSWRSENGGVGLHYLDGEAWDRFKIE